MTSCCLLFAVLRILLIRFLRGFGSRIVFLRIRIHNNVTFKNQASSLKSFLFFNVIFLASTDIFFLGKIHIVLLLNQPPNDPDPHWSAIESASKWSGTILFCYESASKWSGSKLIRYKSASEWSGSTLFCYESASKWSGFTLFCYWIRLYMTQIHFVLLWISLKMIRIHIILLLNQPPNDPDP